MYICMKNSLGIYTELSLGRRIDNAVNMLIFHKFTLLDA